MEQLLLLEMERGKGMESADTGLGHGRGWVARGIADMKKIC